MDQSKQIYEWMFEKEHTEWQYLIFELVKDGKVDPWDLDISVLVQEYLKLLNDLKKMNFKLSGNVVLALTILLRLKMSQLGLADFISLTNELENPCSDEDLQFSDFPGETNILEQNTALLEEIGIDPKSLIKKKMPGPRNRKVTVYELVDALKKAINVEEKRSVRLAEIQKSVKKMEIEKPKNTIFDRIQAVYSKLKDLLSGEQNKILFDDLVMSKHRKDLVWTLVPLLHLCNDGAVKLNQKEAFGPIEVFLGDIEWIPKKEEVIEKKTKLVKKKASKRKTTRKKK